MSIAKLRSSMYQGAKLLGDVQAGRKAARQRSLSPLWDRIRRRMIGRALSRFIR